MTENNDTVTADNLDQQSNKPKPASAKKNERLANHLLDFSNSFKENLKEVNKDFLEFEKYGRRSQSFCEVYLNLITNHLS